jgi:hypothetical protein
MFSKSAIIGTGNIGTWLFKTLQTQSNLTVVSVAGRKIETLPSDYDLYSFALKDDVYEEVLRQIPFKMPHALHTSGALSQNILAPYAEKFGVLYPYQTITQNAESGKQKAECDEALSPSNFEGVPEGRGSLYNNYELRITNYEVPICIESSDVVFENDLYNWATTVFPIVHKINEQQRFAMHLAAVFASNFTNAMYDIAYQIFQKNNLDWSLIFPLLENTLAKAKYNAPHSVQTGPAVRKDITIMERHCNALVDEELKELYQLVSIIIQHHKPQTTNHKPLTTNHKPQTTNHKPLTTNHYYSAAFIFASISSYFGDCNLA